MLCTLTPGFYGRLFVVPKSSGGWRPVLDLSPLNAFLRKIPFRMETPASVRTAVREGDWATSVDLSDAYFHVLMHPSDRKYLRFTVDGRTYQFRALPFGLSLAPWIFTRIVRELCSYLRGKGVRLRAYLDDWLILASSQEQCAAHTLLLLQSATELGFLVNYRKSELTPSQEFSFLGMEFDTRTFMVRPTLPRVRKLQALLAGLRRRRVAPARVLMSLLGMMESLSPLIPLQRLHKREFQRQFRARWSQTTGQWSDLVELRPWLSASTTQWRDFRWLRTGLPITLPPPETEMFTDASHYGWGAHLAHLTASGPWSVEQASMHINALEMEAVVRALPEFAAQMRLSHVLLCTDNTTVACYLNKQGGARSRVLSEMAESLLLWCHEQEISLTARHVPGKINIVADQLSRPHQILHTEWTLVPTVLAPIWEAWRRPHIDLFATRFNLRLPIYVSPVPDPGAWRVDALSFPWNGLDLYAFPPWPILGKVLRKARVDQASMVLIAPDWPAQPWYPELLELTHVPPLRLHLRARSLVQPRTGVAHGNPTMLNLHAWLLCGAGCSHAAHRTTR